LWDRDKAVIGATIAVLALNFLALQPATPRGIDDREYTTAVASPSQAEEFTRSQGAEARDQEDGAVPDAVKTCQQLGVHVHRKNRLVGLFDLGNEGLASDVSLNNLLVNGLRQSSFDQIAHMVNNRVRVFFRSRVPVGNNPGAEAQPFHRCHRSLGLVARPAAGHSVCRSIERLVILAINSRIRIRRSATPEARQLQQGQGSCVAELPFQAALLRISL